MYVNHDVSSRLRVTLEHSAADAGIGEAQFQMGICAMNGVGLEKV